MYVNPNWLLWVGMWVMLRAYAHYVEREGNRKERSEDDLREVRPPAGPVYRPLWTKGTSMSIWDLIYVLIAVAFFAVAVLYTRACDKL